MKIFGTRPSAALNYYENDMRRELAQVTDKARAAKIHQVLIERALKSGLDAYAQFRAVTEPIR
jgi:hypothetical protein